MSNFINPTTTTASTTGVPLVPGATTTTALPASGGFVSDNHRAGQRLTRHEKKMAKHQDKAFKHETKALRRSQEHQHHNQHGLPLVGDRAATTAGSALPVGGVGAVLGATNVIEHQPIVEREVVVERPVEVRREHHIQPVIHEREHQIQPVIRTEVTTERRDMLAERDVMLPAIAEQPRVAVLHQTATDHRGVLPSTGTGAHHATIGQKIKGTVKEVQGSLTHNPAKKEEGRLLKQGIDPTTAGLNANTTGF